jgi:putative acetyltransferase
MGVRLYHYRDLAAVAEVFCAAVRRLGPTIYSPEQVAVWAHYGERLPDLQNSLSLGVTFVFEDEQGLAGFGQLFPIHQVNYLYVHPDRMRQGIGTALFRELEASAQRARAPVIDVQANPLSRAFFAHQGLRVVEKDIVYREGLAFERWYMAKPLKRSRPTK